MNKSFLMKFILSVFSLLWLMLFCSKKFCYSRVTKILPCVFFLKLYDSSFDYMMPKSGFLCIYPGWSLLSFLDLYIDIIHQFWKNFGHYLLKDFFCLFLFLGPQLNMLISSCSQISDTCSFILTFFSPFSLGHFY